MSLHHILIFWVAGLILGRFVSSPLRLWIIMAGSSVAVFWMQPLTGVRNLDFWFPFASLVLVLLAWAVTRQQRGAFHNRQNLIAAGILVLVPLAIGLTRFWGPVCCLTATRPPPLAQILTALVVVGLLTLVLAWFSPNHRWLVAAGIVLILLLFLLLKSPQLATRTSAVLRLAVAQDPNLASPVDLRWLGFSYLAFRLLHVLLDRWKGRLPEVNLREMVSYAVFYPAYTAGPIDRVERFSGDLRRTFNLGADEAYHSTRRVAIGIFKKFVLADSLAVIALNARNATQVDQTFWMWVLLYAFALQIYLDFSGLIDIAIGLGIALGIKLPENFDRPYLQPNLTRFWNSWHITLAQWFRSYYFNPLTRALRASSRQFPAPLIIFLGQVSTMLLIGLWHGFTWNFAIWGLWHGLGLFVHNRWTALTRPRLSPETDQPAPAWRSRIFHFGGVFLTFNYVALGWVWFALPTPGLSLAVLGTLLGFG